MSSMQSAERASDSTGSVVSVSSDALTGLDRVQHLADSRHQPFSKVPFTVSFIHCPRGRPSSLTVAEKNRVLHPL